MSSLLAAARTKRESGFTLIELLTVIVIIGILAAIAIPVFTSQRQRAQDARAVSEARTTVTALESFAAGSPGGTITVGASLANAPTAAQLTGATGEGSTAASGDTLETTVTFGSGGYTVATKNTAGKANTAYPTSVAADGVTVTGKTGATFSQGGTYTSATAQTLVLGA